jgi:uncharacterized protein (DUF2141 family)
MKSTRTICAFLLAVGWSAVGPPRGVATDVAALRVVVTAPQGSAGTCALALFDDRKRFEAGDAPIRKTTLPLAGGACAWRIDDLPAGDYALKAYLDTNGNGQLDKGRLGVPTEPYGFSNDARGRLGPPSWDKTRFTLDAGGREVAVAVR